jgi:RNA polymerase sigma factor (sigma-70 family)
MSTLIDSVWKKIGSKIINYVKVVVLEKHLEVVNEFFLERLTIIIRRYSRTLPLHVLDTESEDLKTIAQLELIESIKAWDPINNDEVWPLAQMRMLGAMRDHIRYLSKADPTRVYEWVNDQASNYINSKTPVDHSTSFAMKDEIKQAMKQLEQREQFIIYAHVKLDLTFKVIGERIDLSESQVSRVYKKAISKLKKIINSNT